MLFSTPSISFKAGEKVTVIVNELVRSTVAQPAIASSFSFLAQAGPFEGLYKERPTAGILGVVYGNADWGDYDGDGNIDLVVMGFDPAYNSIAIIYNNVNGVFTDIGAGLIGATDSACEWGDYDGDGDLDLIIAGLDDSYTNRIAKIYRNDGAGTFTDISAGLTGVDFASVDWGDCDNDGDLDLVIAGRYSFSPDFQSTIIYQNNGGVFTDIGASLVGVTNGSADWGGL
ncbi:MAG: VCBS repeat-containing protein [Cytophagales bacterium]|nr:VCBS repeat-containing protein [Cytophagales bacterium]